MPQQFQGKPKIEVLVAAFARQLQELLVIVEKINVDTDLTTAIGKQLDYVGNILSLTRKEAGEMEGRKSTEPVLADERYRQFLRYQLLKNTTEGTYADTMAGLELMYGDVPILYSEVKNHPATLHLTVPKVSFEEDFLQLNRNFILRSSGVGFYYTAVFYDKINISFLEEVKVLLVIFRMAVKFWQCHILDGMWNLDGTYLLDAVRQSLPMRLVLKGIRAYSIESYRMFLRMNWELPFVEKIKNIKNRIHLWFPFWDLPMLNGTWLLDGSVLLDAIRQSFPMRLLLKKMSIIWKGTTEMEMVRLQQQLNISEEAFLPHITMKAILELENRQTGRVVLRMEGSKEKEMLKEQDVIMKKDLWFLDGMVKLNGSRILDAELWKEELL